MISTPDDPQKEFKEFVKWTKRLFDDDPIALHLVFQIYKAINDKQTSLMGVIVESEPPETVPQRIVSDSVLDIVSKSKHRGKPIMNKEVIELWDHLDKKGLPTNHKRDNI